MKRAATNQACLSDAVSVHAAGRGNPFINLSDGRDVITGYDGPTELVEALEENNARPLSLASADFDEDGVPDLISGYAGPSGGIVTLHRGNLILFIPTPQKLSRGKQKGLLPRHRSSPRRLFFLCPRQWIS